MPPSPKPPIHQISAKEGTPFTAGDEPLPVPVTVASSVAKNRNIAQNTCNRGRQQGFCHYSIRSTKPNTFPPPPMPLQTRNKLSISILLPYPMQPFFVSTSFHAASPSRFVNIDPYRPSLHRHSPGPTLNFSKPSPSHPHIHLLLQSRHPLLNLNCKARLITSAAWRPKRAQHYLILMKWGAWVRIFFPKKNSQLY